MDRRPTSRTGCLGLASPASVPPRTQLVSRDPSKPILFSGDLPFRDTTCVATRRGTGASACQQPTGNPEGSFREHSRNPSVFNGRVPETRGAQIVKMTPDLRPPISTPLRNPQKQQGLQRREKQTDTPSKVRPRPPLPGWPPAPGPTASGGIE